MVRLSLGQADQVPVRVEIARLPPPGSDVRLPVDRRAHRHKPFVGGIEVLDEKPEGGLARRRFREEGEVEVGVVPRDLLVYGILVPAKRDPEAIPVEAR